jgi:RHS repeat-associated protein
VNFKNEIAFNAGNVFTVQLSDSGGSFASAKNIGTQNGTNLGWDSLTASIPSTTINGVHYKARVVATNPVDTSTTSAAFVIGPNLDTITAGGATTFCSGGSVTLSSKAENTYLWSNAATTQSVSITSSGTYLVSVTANGCTAVSNSTVVTVNSNPTAPTITPSDSSGTTYNDGIICIGAHVSLQSSAATSYAWSTGATMQMLSGLTPSSNTTYSITITNANGCTASTSSTVTVNSLPSASATSNSPVCAGQALNLTGGANGLTSYAWSGPSSFSSSSQSLTVSSSATSVMAGTYSITATNSNGCSASVSTSVTVNSVPTVSASSNSPVCAGQTLNLTGGASGLTTYAWSGPSSYSSSTQSPTISSSASTAMSGTYNITVTNGNGCTASSNTSVTVNANPAVPTITAGDSSGLAYNDGIICSGASASLQSSVSHAYLWSTGDSTQVVNGLAPRANAAYSVTITDVNGCKSSNSYTIRVNPNVSLSVSDNSGFFCALGQLGYVQLSVDSGTGPFAFTWSTGDTIQGIANLGPGYYAVTVSDSNACVDSISDILTCAEDCNISNLTLACNALLPQLGGNAAYWSINFDYVGFDGSPLLVSAGHVTFISSSTSAVQSGINRILISAFIPDTNSYPADTFTISVIDRVAGDTCIQILPVSIANNSAYYLPSCSSSHVSLSGGKIQCVPTDSASTLPNYLGTLTLTNNSGGTVIGVMANCTNCYSSNETGGGILNPGVSNDAVYFQPDSLNQDSVTLEYLVSDSTYCSLCKLGYTIPILHLSGLHFTAGDSTLCAGNTACYQASASNSQLIYYAVSNSNASINALTGCVTNVTDSFTVLAIAQGAFECTIDTAYFKVTVPVVGVPTAPSSQSVCSDTVVTFTFADTAGTAGNELEWAINSDFYGSQIVSSPYHITKTVGPGGNQSIWLRSMDSITGCVSDAIYAQAIVHPLPVAVSAVASADTVCPYGSVSITIPNSQGGYKYSLLVSSTVLDTAYGNGNSLNLNPPALTSTRNYSIIISDTSTGCSFYQSGAVSVIVTNTIGAPQFIMGDTVVYANENMQYAAVNLGSSNLIYFIDTGSATIDSASGWLYDYSSNFIVGVATPESSGCAVANAYLPVTFSPNPAIPVIPPAQSAWSDTTVTFIISGFAPGNGGDALDWTTDSTFTTFQTIQPYNPLALFRSGSSVPSQWAAENFSVSAAPGTSVTILLRSRTSASSNVSSIVSTTVTTFPSNGKPGVNSGAVVQYVNLVANTGGSGSGNAVGTTPASNSVTSSGALSYTIPIACPPGINNMAPQIALSYSSQGGMGPMGWGWGISGLSSISRSGLDYFHDQKVTPITVTTADAFNIDGTRLTLASGSNGTDGATYVKEVEDYSAITAEGESGGGSGPAWFQVITKQGITMEYGNTPDSKFMSASLGATGSVLQWRLSKVYDQDGNYMLYKYDTTGGGCRIAEIDYTGNGNQSPFCAMTFAYSLRFDSNTLYTAGTPSNSKYLLDTISVTSGNVSGILPPIVIGGPPSPVPYFKRYVLNYVKDDLSSFLGGMTEFGTDGSQLNPIVFQYGTQPDNSSYSVVSSSFDQTWSWPTITVVDVSTGKRTTTVENPFSGLFNTDQSTISELSGDFNGDGYADMMVIYQATSTAAVNAGLITPYNLAFRVNFMNPSSGAFTNVDQVAKEPGDAAFETCADKVDMHENYDYFVGDFSGSGRDGILEIRHYCNDGQLTIGSINYYTYDNAGNRTSQAFSTPTDVITSANGGYVSVGDFDADGIMDYIFYLADGSQLISFPGKGLFNQPLTFNWAGPFRPNAASYQKILTSTFKYKVGSEMDTIHKDTTVTQYSPYLHSSVTITYPVTDYINVPVYDAGTYDSLAPVYNSYVVDFDGDGKSDLLFETDTASLVYIFNTDAEGNYSFTPMPQSLKYPNLTDNDQIYFGDFNADGKTDILTHQKNGTSVPTNIALPSNWRHSSNFNFALTPASGKQTTTDKWEVGYSTGLAFNEQAFLQNEFNRVYGNSAVYGTLSSSDGTSVSFATPEEYGAAMYSSQEFITGDFNGDGKTDILFNIVPISATANANGINWNYSGCTAQTKMYYSQGTQFLEYGLTGAGKIAGANCVTGDFNGDGATDAAFYNTSIQGNCEMSSSAVSLDNSFADDYYQFSFASVGFEKPLQTVTDPFGQVKYFNYLPLTNATVHTEGTNYTYPLISVQPPMYVVSTAQLPDGIGSTNNITYSYTNALMDKGGLGFLGFASVMSQASIDNVVSVVQSTFASPFYAPTCTGQAIVVGGTLVKTVKNYFSQNYIGINHYNIQKNSSYSTDNLANATTQVFYQYDNWGNATSVNSDINGIETSTVTSTYGQYGTPCPALPITVSISKTRFNSTYNNEIVYSYYPDSRVQNKLVNPTGCGVSYTYTYDGFGNCTSQTSFVNNSTNSETRTQNYQFTANGRFPQSVSNALNQQMTFTYDGNWGKPSSVVALDNTTTTYTFDAFGRVSNVHTPRNTNIANAIAWAYSSAAGPNAIFSATITQPGKPTLQVYKDAMGREIMRQAMGFNGNWLTSTNLYTCSGKDSVITKAHYSGESPSMSTYTYDNLDRPVSMTDQFNDITSVLYAYGSGDLSITTTRAGRATTKTTDATGKLISSTDEGGSLNYFYDGYGNTLQVSNGSTAILSSTYDACNHKTSQTEPNSGTFTYSYDAYGQLLTQTDGNGNTYTMQYDVLGRLTQQVGSLEGTTTYSYVPGGQGGANKIASVSGFSGVTQSYTYDQYSDPQSITELINSADYVTTNSYDANGNISGTYYGNSGLKINYSRDSYGYMTSIADSNTGHTLYTANSMNCYGQATNYTLGNGLTSTLTTDFGFPTRYYTPGIQDLNLSYNYATGDLQHRQDNISNNIDSFTFDNNDRLISAQVNSAPPMNFAFADNGNISNKTDVGNYTYGNQPNAVNWVSNDSGNIKRDTQNITYIGFNKASVITEQGYELDYTYDASFSRKYSTLKRNDTVINTRVYSGRYELEDNQTGHPQQIHYINGNNGLVAVIVIQDGVSKEYYTYTDQLGSILTVTDDTGNIKASQNFDAWGRNRNPSDWTYKNIPAVSTDSNICTWLYRGYTGHEMLPQFGLINMNGRMYDPLLARMLSPDNNVADPASTQAYNKYSYCVNNPLKYTDPTGWVPKPKDGESEAAWALYANGWNNAAGSGSGFGSANAMASLVNTVINENITTFQQAINQALNDLNTDVTAIIQNPSLDCDDENFEVTDAAGCAAQSIQCALEDFQDNANSDIQKIISYFPNMSAPFTLAVTTQSLNVWYGGGGFSISFNTIEGGPEQGDFNISYNVMDGYGVPGVSFSSTESVYNGDPANIHNDIVETGYCADGTTPNYFYGFTASASFIGKVGVTGDVWQDNYGGNLYTIGADVGLSPSPVVSGNIVTQGQTKIWFDFYQYFGLIK